MSPVAPHPAGRRRAAFAFIVATAVLEVVAMGVIMPVLPTIIGDLAGSTAEAGTYTGALVGAWALAQFLAAPVLGSLSDRFGRRPVILVSCGGLALDCALMAWAPSLGWLALGRVLGGFTSASIAAVYAYTADVTPEDKRAKSFGWVGASFSVGFVLGPGLGGLLAPLGARAPLWAAAAVALVSFVYGLVVLPESLTVDKRMAFAWKRANPVGSLALLRKTPTLFSLSTVLFLLASAGYVFHAVFALYAKDRFGLGATAVGALLATSAVFDIFVQLVLIEFLVKRIGERGTLLVGLAGGALACVGMGLAPNLPVFVASMCGAALWGVSFPPLQSLMTQHVSESEQGQLQGANMGLMALSGIAAPVIFGSTYSLFVGRLAHVGLPGAPFLLGAAVLVASALVADRATRGAGGAGGVSAPGPAGPDPTSPA